MAQSSGFFTSHVVQGMQDRVYTAAQYCEYFSHFIGNGIFPNPSTQLQVVSRSGWDLAVLEGYAWINGYWFKEDREAILTIDFANDYMDRIDAVVLRWNNDDRLIRIYVKKGEPTPGGKRPEMQRDDNIYELCLAYVEVKQGVTQISQANIVDVRLDNRVCGIVHGLVEQVDTSVLHDQYQQILKEETDMFSAWFATIKNILDTNVAAHLMNIFNETMAGYGERLDFVEAVRLGESDDIEVQAGKNQVSGWTTIKFFVPFQAIPRVIATVNDSTGEEVTIQNVTTNGFQAYVTGLYTETIYTGSGVESTVTNQTKTVVTGTQAISRTITWVAVFDGRYNIEK